MTNASNNAVAEMSLFKVLRPVDAERQPNVRAVEWVWATDHRDATRKVATAAGDWRGIQVFQNGRRVY